LEHIEKYFDCDSDDKLAKKIGRSVKLGCVFCEAQQVLEVIEDKEAAYALKHTWAKQQDGANWVDSGYEEDTEFGDNDEPREKGKIHRITPKDNKGFTNSPDVSVYDPRDK
jgi:hypothetical protein